MIRGDDWKSLTIALILFSIISLIWLLSEKVILLLFIKLGIAIAKKGQRQLFSEVSAFEFYDNYFVEFADGIKTEIPYSKVFKLAVNENNAIYIYRNQNSAYLIPFNVFVTDDARNEFLTFIGQKIET